MARTYIGVSGWNYPEWRTGFYEGLPAHQWLHHCAKRFQAIEVNATHYRLQTPETFARWAAETPPGFRFALKGHRFVTHDKKLLAPEEPLELERDRALALGAKLAAVVWQLPQTFAKNLERLDRFCAALEEHWPVRHAMELRHPSWFDEDVRRCLARHDVAIVQSDAERWPLWDAVSTDLVYVRLHGHTRTYASRYSTASLRAWAKRTKRWLSEGRDVHVYFDNDAEGAAPRDAQRLMALVDESAAQVSG